MEPTATLRPAIDSPRAFAAFVDFATVALVRWTRAIGARLAQRARAARDYEALARMSDRELGDIGLARGYVAYAAAGRWTREEWAP